MFSNDIFRGFWLLDKRLYWTFTNFNYLLSSTYPVELYLS
jgi:hypothetical protein